MKLLLILLFSFLFSGCIGIKTIKDAEVVAEDVEKTVEDTETVVSDVEEL